jgi:hypothetical protein
MIRAATLCMALTAAPAFAQEFTEDQKAALIAAAAASDCDLTTAEVREELSLSGVDPLVAEAIAVDLIDRGQARISDDDTLLTLEAEDCPNIAP